MDFNYKEMFCVLFTVNFPTISFNTLNDKKSVYVLSIENW